MVRHLRKCALCDEETKLELSHIVPKMAIKALKKTAIGNIRNVENPNMVVQDSEKHYMLCSQCEDLFSECETYFARSIFHPYLNKKKTEFEYNDKLFYFITSVSWRSLYLDLLDFVENNVVGIDALECLINAERIMKDYLLHKRDDIGEIENHIFFFEDVVEANGMANGRHVADLHPNATYHRGIFSYTVCEEKAKTYVTITNMLGVVLLTFYHMGTEEKWENTLILNGTGKVVANEQKIQSVVANEFIHVLKTTEEAFNSISQVQKEKIVERFKKVEMDIEEAAIYQEWKKDAEIMKR